MSRPTRKPYRPKHKQPLATTAAESGGAVTVFRSDGNVNVTIRTSAIPPPRLMMTSTWAGAELDGSTVRMLFGQSAPGQQRLLAALDVSIPRGSLYRIIYEGNADFLPVLRRVASEHGLSSSGQGIDPARYPTERVVFERVNLAAISYMDDHAELDFYRVSPRVLRDDELSVRGDDAVTPVVGVVMSLEILYALIERLVALVPRAD